MDFAPLVVALRDRLGLTQEQLASRLRTSVPTISRWETGKTRPDSRALHLLETFVREQGAGFQDLLDTYFSNQAKENARKHRQSRQKAGATSLDTSTMEGMLWKAACDIRGEKDAPKFKDYILPLLFLKRLSDVFDDEIARLREDLGSEEVAEDLASKDHSLVRFYLPPEARWSVVSRRVPLAWPEGREPASLGEQLTMTFRAVARANPVLQGVVDIRDFNETHNGEREMSDAALARLIETLSNPRYRLGLKDVEPDFLGRAYEYLLRKFAEGQGQSAGEFFTPKEVGVLMARLVAPQPGESVYDPCCGSGGLLIKCQLELERRLGGRQHVERPLRLHGQELGASSFALARMNMVIHDLAGEVARGNTMTNPKFALNGGLERFDLVVTNPMWNQSNFEARWYETDPFGRFAGRGGFAPAGSADWAWVQHVRASLSDDGRAAVVLDTGAASRGSGKSSEDRERAIRRWFVDNDQVEGVILLPDNLFYNTTAAGIVILLNLAKAAERSGKLMFVNASADFEKGRPKNYIPEVSIDRIAGALGSWSEIEGFARVVDAGTVAEKDWNLSPSTYVSTIREREHRDIREILDDLGRIGAESRRLDSELERIFTGLGYCWPGGD